MVLSHVMGLLTQPKQEWRNIRDEKCTIQTLVKSHLGILAAIPPVAGFIGTTMVGWQIGSGERTHLTVGSALLIAIIAYFAIIACIMILGRTIHWMAKTYGSNPDEGHALALAAYTVSPLLLMGVVGLYPSLWLFMLVGLSAIAYSVYLLYTGVPVVMDIPQEQGFVFSSAILTVGLVMLMGLMVTTVLFWGFGFGPTFT
jgi:hypothetical protein